MSNPTPPTIHAPNGNAVAGPSSSASTRSASPNPLKHNAGSASHGRLSKLMVPGRARSGSSASQKETTVTAYADEGSVSSSGRSTPEQRRKSCKAAATSLLVKDAKYKKFASQVDKCLQSFESVNEWADFISFLSRLLKTLQASSTYNEIPRKLIVSKRLAQCLNPALPSGVHQRALDVYAHVFSTIGAEGLRRDMLIWSSGFFPFFQFASTSVRPQIINIFSTYYLPLGQDLRPATKAIILALLPGLEEETGDFFDKILSFFARMASTVNSSFFLSNIFLILISSPASRLSALNYLNKTLPEPPDTGDGIEPGLVIRGVAATLDDDNVLVRRFGLDLLLRILRLDDTIMRDATKIDRRRLMRMAIGVTLQRDMSLSRRVYIWILGKDEAKEKQVAYFKVNALNLLETTLMRDMALHLDDSTRIDVLRPFKIFLSLLDKWEIGSDLSERMAASTLTAIKTCSEQLPEHQEELRTTASAIYEALDPTVLWGSVYRSMKAQLIDDGENDDLAVWVVQQLPQKDEEVVNIHMPILLHSVISWLESGEIKVNRRGQACDIAENLFRMIPTALLQEPSDSDAMDTISTDIAVRMYDRKVKMEETLLADVRTRIIPHLVSETFKLSSKGFSDSETLAILRMQNLLVDVDASALGTISTSKWLPSLLAMSSTRSFTVVEAAMGLLIKASRSSMFPASLSLVQSDTMETILDSLFGELRMDAVPHHTRCVNLIWEFNQLAAPHLLQDVISRRMSSTHSGKGDRARDAFGILWRLTDDAMLPGQLFQTPICNILASLRSGGVETEHAELWLGNNLGSYFRILDPLLTRLLDPEHHASDLATQSRSSIDVAVVQGLLDNLFGLIQYGGHSLSRICQTTEISRSPYPLSTVAAGEVHADFTGNYLDLLTMTLLGHLEQEHLSTGKREDSPRVISMIQSTVIDILSALTSFGDMSNAAVQLIKFRTLQQLDHMVSRGRTILQPKLLGLLQDAISMSTKHHKTHTRASSINEKSSISSMSIMETGQDFDHALVDLAISAVASSSSFLVYQHWCDYILVLTSRLQARVDLLQTLLDAVSTRLRQLMISLRFAFDHDTNTTITQDEPIMLLTASDRLVNLCLSVKQPRRSEDSRHGNDGGGLLGLVSGVFIGETAGNPAAKAPEKSSSVLLNAVKAFMVTWQAAVERSNDSIHDSDAPLFPRVQSKLQAVMDKLYKSQPVALLETIVEIWDDHAPDSSDSTIFNCIDALAPSAQKVVEIISAAITNKLKSTLDLSTSPLLPFLEAYISRLEAPIAVQVWGTLFNFAREMLSMTASSTPRAQLYPTLRSLTRLSKIVATTNAFEDRRLRRDLQEVFGKILDAVASAVSKLGDTPTRETRLSRNDNMHTLAEDIQLFFAQEILPNLRNFLHETDRITAACATISSSVISPAFRQQRVNPVVLQMLIQMTKIPSATKAWRLPVGEAFNDAKFFQQNVQIAETWRPLVCSLMNNDKDRFVEILARITAAPSANIFVNREQETIARSTNLRRLSFVLFSADTNHYLTDLPAIQEALVEILRTSVVSSRVHSEVYLCLRIVMCRFSPQHVTNFWPVILAELLRIFEGVMDEVPSDNSDSLHLILAACKFLDLLLVMQSEDFQIHQWMFITDTTDAICPPEHYTPEAIIDRLAEALSEHSNNHANDPTLQMYSATDTDGLARRPRLAGINSISSLHQLQPFFSRASMDIYEGVYSDNGVDWDVVEDALKLEMFTERN